MLRRRTLAALAVLTVLAAACGSAGAETDETLAPVTPVPTIGGVGVVPVAPSAVREPVVVVPLPVDVEGTTEQLIGETVDGNRVLMIGDSILASTSSRYGNHMCEAVVPLGWQVAVEAEPSRFVDFGNTVLDRLLPDDVAPDDDWDAAVVFLGSNYRGDPVAYEAELNEILDRLDDRPVLLLTVTEYRPNYVEVNVVVNRMGADRDNVSVLDWKTISETPGVLSGDRLHPTDAGRQVLADAVAAALGPVPDGVGDCLRSTFRNDSRVSGNSNTVLGRPSSSSRSSSSSSSSSSSGGSGSTGSGSVTTTVRPATTATTTALPPDGGGEGETDGGGGESTNPPDGGGAITTAPTVPTTPPPTTQPPVTQPPVTQPPATQPPATQPPVTQPPTTQPPPSLDGGGAEAGSSDGASATP